MISKSEFIDWKNSHVTEHVINMLKERIEELKTTLAKSAGVDPLQDRWVCGVIDGYHDLINIDYEETE